MAICERRSTVRARVSAKDLNAPIRVGSTNGRLASIPPFVSIIRIIDDELELLALVYNLRRCYHVCEQWL